MVKLLKPFKYAISGLLFCFKTQQNFKVHLLLATITLVAGACLQISQWQWIVISFCISMVLAAELFNSAIEKICDHVNPAYHPQIKIIKDMAAGAVLVVALMSIVTGLLVFIPAILNYINS
ncbi:MAG TPA: diacylglycerol kinase family protein [Ferruginibacter sp.]|nr:diacylglycerol kinase family protein [Chitinophagaceae bacterium]MBP6287090.1 diacylglycerol kinase family protein [Ferruginibacter sp.]HQY11677.1 diacylglycerol kinase family protein [Ferruginibacter sp.]